MLAFLAGLAVAGRAMRPIASLTAAAREIASTRDPSRRLPTPETDDEVAELARTLDEMLRELDAARSETQQMIQAQRDFVADASHELRTPLTSILANLELLEASLAERGADARRREIVAGALGSSRRMRRLVSDLLLLARADAGRAGPRRECDLVEIADGALAEVRPVAAGTNSCSTPTTPWLSSPTPTTSTAWSSTCSTTAFATPRPGPTSRVPVAAATATRCSRSATTGRVSRPARRSDLRPLRARRRTGRPRRPTPAPASGLRSSRRSPSRNGQVEVGRSVAGGARFTGLAAARPTLTNSLAKA